MPIISNSAYCIDRRKLEFNLINKELYKNKLFNSKVSKTQRFLYKYLKSIPVLRRLVQVEMRDTTNWENYPVGDKNYIFICVAKSASTSINLALNHYLHSEPKYHHMSINDLKEYYPELNFDDYYKFAFVRNPWDRFLSLYHDINDKRNGKSKIMNYSLLENKYKTIFYNKKNFKDFAKSFGKSGWINEAHFRPQLDYLISNGELAMDFVGRFENLQDDWDKIKKDIGFKKLGDLKHEMKSKVKIDNYKKFYDNETIDIVARIYKKDIEFFGYDY